MSETETLVYIPKIGKLLYGPQFDETDSDFLDNDNWANELPTGWVENKLLADSVVYMIKAILDAYRAITNQEFTPAGDLKPIVKEDELPEVIEEDEDGRFFNFDGTIEYGEIEGVWGVFGVFPDPGMTIKIPRTIIITKREKLDEDEEKITLTLRAIQGFYGHTSVIPASSRAIVIGKQIQMIRSPAGEDVNLSGLNQIDFPNCEVIQAESTIQAPPTLNLPKVSRVRVAEEKMVVFETKLEEVNFNLGIDIHPTEHNAVFLKAASTTKKAYFVFITDLIQITPAPAPTPGNEGVVFTVDISDKADVQFKVPFFSNYIEGSTGRSGKGLIQLNFSQPSKRVTVYE